MNNKRVLLIAGGGTLGTYTAKELLSLGCFVDVLCPEDKISDNDRLRYFKGLGNREVLEEIFSKNRYDGIVNFIHYKNVDEYKAIHPFLISNTEHLIFLSSYRVYANEEQPITESSPRIFDVTDNADYFTEEDYSCPKALAENYLRGERMGEPWTIVRPVISFSKWRMDLHMYSRNDLLENDTFTLPVHAKDLHAGIDWAGNSGKLIARLLFNPRTFGNTYTVSSAQNLTWGEVADIYTEILGIKIEWVDESVFLENNTRLLTNPSKWVYNYDRKYDRLIDNSAILSVTGLSAEDFVSISEGIRIELDNIKEGK